jgi:hypothetical protein
MSAEADNPVFSIERGQSGEEDWQRILELARSAGASLVEHSRQDSEAEPRYINAADFYAFAEKNMIISNVAGRAYKGLIRIFLEQRENPTGQLSKLAPLQFDRLSDDLSKYHGIWDGSIGDLRFDSLRQFVDSMDQLLAPATTKDAKQQVCGILPEGVRLGTIEIYRWYVEQSIDSTIK